ncbi:MAG: hypothetical protein EAZ57_07330 [Cytophagales bacterium]|nr:MAG: hypothetical protein EAZ67_08140 [Cytophagales bacterium]TAF60513.1 MAG: hypothetical protein EAZ57_07330 [Cytophagales bacterium]
MPKAFKIYSASAGSGKTYTLALSYLRVALAAPDADPSEPYNPRYFRFIAAITFTKAAAAEMKHRILDYLKLVAETDLQKPSTFFEQLYASVVSEYAHRGIRLSRADLVERGRAAYLHLLHFYSDFNVKTIDSFIQSLAQAFAHELDLPKGFQLELDKSETYGEAIYRLLMRVGTRGDKHLSSIMREYALGEMEDKFNKKTSDNLVEFAEKTDAPLYARYIRRWQAYSFEEKTHIKQFFVASLKYVRKGASGHIKQLARSGLKIIAEYNLGEANFQGNSAYAYLSNIITKRDENSTKILEANTSAYVKNIIGGKNLGLEKSCEKKRTEGAYEGLTEAIADVVRRIETSRANLRLELNLAQAFCGHVYPMLLVDEIKRITEALQHEQGTAFLDQITQKINEIVLTDPMPYIYERLGEKYKHIFIDEFQDTSETQFTSLLPLQAHALSLDRDCLVVGDTKQAIYRWRGGNTELLAGIHRTTQLSLVKTNELLMEHAMPLQAAAENRVLGTNYRSLDNVIAFNNSFFQFLVSDIKKLLKSDHEDLKFLQAFYTDVTQKTSKGPGGEVSVAFFKKEKASSRGFKSPDSELESEAKPSADYDAWNQTQTLALIEKSLAEGYQYSDIAVIVRTNLQACGLANSLVNTGIPVISAEALLLINSFEIQALINFMMLLKYPHMPDVKLNLLHFFFYYQQNCSQPQNPSADDYHTFAQQAQKIDISDFFTFVFERFGYLFDYTTCLYLTLYEVAEEFARTIALGKRQDIQIYWQAILDITQEEGRKRHNNVSDFIDYWRKKEKKLAVSAPEGTNAVQVLTIHKSKGLQYPVVIVPFADWGGRLGKGTLWRDLPAAPLDVPEPLDFVIFKPQKSCIGTPLEVLYKDEQRAQMLESINALYVAFTRAEERLHILSQKVEKPEEDPFSFCNKLLLLYDKHLKISQHAQLEVDDKMPDEQNEDAIYYLFGPSPRTTKPREVTEEKVQLSDFFSTNTRQQLNLRFSNLKPELIEFESADLLSEARLSILATLVAKRLEHLAKLPSLLEILEEDGLIKPQERVLVSKHLTQAIQAQNFDDFFSSHAKRGLEISTPKGYLLQLHRTLLLQSQVKVLQIYTHADQQQAEKSHKKLEEALQNVYPDEAILIQCLYL